MREKFEGKSQLARPERIAGQIDEAITFSSTTSRHSMIVETQLYCFLSVFCQLIVVYFGYKTMEECLLLKVYSWEKYLT